MPLSTRIALKEWAVVCRAIAKGEQALLFRKGGIREEGKKFTVDHSEFLLFPTLEHQNAEALRPEWQAQLPPAQAAAAPPEEVPLNLFVGVSSIFKVGDLEPLLGLSAYHPYSEMFFKMRLAYKPKEPLWVLLVRAFELPKITSIPNLPRYAGCKSWVELEEEIPCENLKPVLSLDRFMEIREKVTELLGKPT